MAIGTDSPAPSGLRGAHRERRPKERMNSQRYHRRRPLTLSLLAFALALTAFMMTAACSGDEAADSDSSADVVENNATALVKGGAESEGVIPAEGATVALQEGAVARYLVQEQFANVDLPNDAIGETSDVQGAFTFDESGNIVSGESRIVMNAASLRSDESRRDNYLSQNAIQTGQYPEIVFVATGVTGLPWPLPVSGEHTFEIQGDLTVREVTRPVAWQTTASFDGATVTGAAKIAFTFGEFEMEVPDLFFLLSVDDNIRLELDFVASY